MAGYVTRPGGYDLSLAGPFHNRSANMRVHVLNAELKPLFHTLNRYLNPFTRPFTGYVPLGDRVVMTCADVGDARAGDHDLGSMHEVEVAFFILALYCNPLPRRIVSFAPYLFVNNSWAMVMGREIHGFRKDIAVSFHSTLDVDGTQWPGRAGDVEHVVAWAMPRAAADARLERLKLVEIRNQGQGATSELAASRLVSALVGSGSADLARELPKELAEGLSARSTAVAGSELLAELVNGLQVELPVMFLRQFRDPKRSQTTDVQSLVRAYASAALADVPSVVEASQIRLHPAASHPIGRELGLPNAQWITADLSFEMNLDFTFKDAVA